MTPWFFVGFRKTCQGRPDRSFLLVAFTLAAACGLGCARSGRGGSGPRTIRVAPGPKVQSETQTALIKARPGDTIEFGEGTYEFTMGLSLTVNGVTLRGRGMEKTILSFKGQTAGSEGLLVTGNAFTIEDLSVVDTKGDAVKVSGTDGVTMRRVAARWTGGPKESNGGYGLYPVQCKNVLLEDCFASGASDAGIYVGQSTNAVVRRCKAVGNVAGIEAENSTGVDIHDNEATGNTGGVLVFDLPDLPVKKGGRTRVFRNKVEANNHENFAPKGNIVALVPPGTGVMIMAADQVEVFDNTVRDHATTNASIVSYFVTGKPIKDQEYDPFPEGIFIHDNHFSGGGTHPQGEIGRLLAAVAGTPVPDIVWDGMVNKEKVLGRDLGPDFRVWLKNNGGATFANVHWADLDPKKVAEGRARVERDPTPHVGELPSLPPIVLPGAHP